MLDPVQQILAFARQHGLALDAEGARLYVQNRLDLLKTPDDPDVKALAEHFRRILHVGDGDSFEDFLAPFCPHDCPWCHAYNSRYRDRVIAEFRKLPPPRIVEKCEAFFRCDPARPDDPMRREGILNFMARTGLTVAQIEAMSKQELAAFA
jgi:hypothetical protein